MDVSEVFVLESYILLDMKTIIIPNWLLENLIKYQSALYS